MYDILNRYFQAAAQHRFVSFQLTTNHPDHRYHDKGTATYAAGFLQTNNQQGLLAEAGAITALVSQPTRWHFLRSEGGKLLDFGSENDQLTLSLFLRPLADVPFGTLENLNWPEPIPIQTLTVVSDDGYTCLCHGLDGNGAAIAIVLRDRPTK
ncbi:MAG: hypothetical protein KDE51_02060 [Anaerolineales bacterium]|nr:hypothetical protein [Anaerolineales bacterium]